MRNYILSIIYILLGSSNIFSQQVPSKEENIEYIVTFGKDAETSYGDDDFYQIFFFQVPQDYLTPMYIRVFDPEASGKFDESVDGYNTQINYSVYGGKNCSSDSLLRNPKSVDDCKSGIKLKSQDFGNTTDYDGKWFTLGPFNPKEGEFDKYFNTYDFKLIIEGKSGNDGNIYKLFLSSDPDKNIPIEGGNAYTYKYHFRLVSEKNSVAHLYPYANDKVYKIKQHNFDFDNDGVIKIVSTAKNGQIVAYSGDNVWAKSNIKIEKMERNTSLDYQIVKKGSWKNDMVVFFTDQYGANLPFFAIPIGGIPKYKIGIDVIYHR